MEDVRSAESHMLRLGFPSNLNISLVDPISIHSIAEANIIENLYSRLVEYNNEGQIECMLCSSFEIKNKEISFRFAKPIFTKDGKQVGAFDAMKSLKRLLEKNSNTHGNLMHFLDDKDDFKNSLVVFDNKLIVKVKEAKWAPFLLTMFTSMDFSIIPAGSLDETGKIIDYQNTSGVYYLSDQLVSGQNRLIANNRHSLYSSKIPQSVVVIPLKSGSAAEAFQQNKVDMIDVTYFSYANEINALRENSSPLELSKTLNIGLTSLIFSQNCISRTTSAQRFLVGNIIKAKYLEKVPKFFGSLETTEFFQSFGNGFLDDRQTNEIKRLLTTADPVKKNVFTLGLSRKYEGWFKQSEFSDNIKLKFYDASPAFLPEIERPDIYIVNVDSSFDDDISALSYLFNSNIFSSISFNWNTWIRDYIGISDRSERIKRLQSLHFNQLEQAYLIPIASRPYITIIRKAWRLNFPKLHAGTPLWKIEKT